MRTLFRPTSRAPLGSAVSRPAPCAPGRLSARPDDLDEEDEEDSDWEDEETPDEDEESWGDPQPDQGWEVGPNHAKSRL